jgi:hypothetical protein
MPSTPLSLKGVTDFIPRPVNKLEFGLRQNPAVQAQSKFQFLGRAGYIFFKVYKKNLHEFAKQTTSYK